MPLFQIKIPSRTWTQWLNGVPVQRPFISVFYKDGSTYAISAGSDGTIPNFIRLILIQRKNVPASDAVMQPFGGTETVRFCRFRALEGRKDISRW